jgi:dienelactone hydrolase
MFARMAREHKPLCSFEGETKEYFESWKKDTYPRVTGTLGDFPKKVPANPELIGEWEHDDLIKQRWLINVGEHLSAMCLVNIPKGLKKDERRPSILCWHGHGLFGKESVMGNDTTPERRAEIAKCNYNYGHQMAKKGFVTYAIDWMGKGDLDDTGKRHYLSNAGGRDWCNLYYLHATMFGMTPLSINVGHGMAATDFACTLPFVDSDRLGVMGLSGGGTMTAWSAICDERMKAAEIICYSDLWEAFGIRDANYCGSQVAPGLYKLIDVPELQGLFAPKPLLVDIGANDTCFLLEGSMACFRKVEKIYTAAGVRENLHLDLHGGEHGWGGNRSEAFFRKHL